MPQSSGLFLDSKKSKPRRFDSTILEGPATIPPAAEEEQHLETPTTAAHARNYSALL